MMRRKLVTVWLIFFCLALALVGRAAAADGDFDSPLPPDGRERVLLPHAASWFEFDYAGKKMPFEVRLKADAVREISFALFTPDEVNTYRQSGHLQPIGQAARAAGIPANDLVWAGDFPGGGKYYVQVRNGMDEAIAYHLTVTGQGVSFVESAPSIDSTQEANPLPTPAPSNTKPNLPVVVPRPQIPPPSSRGNGVLHVPILMYHHLMFLPANASYVFRTLTVAPSAFEAQVALLAALHYHTIHFSDLIGALRYGRPLPSNPIILTFDDGWEDDYTVAFPILRKYGFVGTFFPPTAYLNGRATLSIGQVWQMSAAGMEFGSHTVDHPFLSRLSNARVWWELNFSRAVLERIVGRAIVVFAYPYGDLNARVINLVAQSGYGAAVGVSGGDYQSLSQIYVLHRTTVAYWYDLRTFSALLR